MMPHRCEVARGKMPDAERGPDRRVGAATVVECALWCQILERLCGLHRCKSARPRGRSGARAAARQSAPLFRAGEGVNGSMVEMRG
jgi:hypothetical protein